MQLFSFNSPFSTPPSPPLLFLLFFLRCIDWLNQRMITNNSVQNNSILGPTTFFSCVWSVCFCYRTEGRHDSDGYLDIKTLTNESLAVGQATVRSDQEKDSQTQRPYFKQVPTTGHDERDGHFFIASHKTWPLSRWWRSSSSSSRSSSRLQTGEGSAKTERWW